MTAAEPRTGGAVTLAEAGGALEMYYKMWTGRSVRFAAGEDRMGAGREDTVSLPAEYGRSGSPALNMAWYFVAVTHRAGHVEFNTFDAPVPPAVAESFQTHAPPSLRDELAIRTSRDLLEVVSAIDQPRQGLYALVRALEDYRIDEALKRSYAGLRADIEEVQQEASALDAGPFLPAQPPRAKFAHLISQMAVGALDHGTPLEPALHQPFADLVRAEESLADVRSTAIDSVAWGLRLWAAMLRLPNMARSYGLATPVDLTRPAAARGPEQAEVPRLEHVPRLEGSDVLSIEIAAALYRDTLAVSVLRHTPAPTAADALLVFDRQHDLALEDGAPEAGDVLVPAPAEKPDLPWERPPEPLPHEHAHEPEEADHPAHGELRKSGPAEFLYPEWDSTRNSYLSSWVRIRESEASGEARAGAGSKAEASIRAYGSVCRRLRAQLESFVPTGVTRQSGFPWGDEINLDAGIQLMVDRRSGGILDDRVYEVQVRGRRDVVAALVLDVSCSTAERREPATAGATGSGHVSLTWTEARSPTVAAKGYRTLLDSEVEMASVVASVISQIGDGFGLYAFSGTGRGDVRFDVLKEIGERWGPAVHRRLDRLRPVHSTRMGAAIRHATRKLARWEASTKILLLLSDGRPFDLDYGPVGAHGHAEFDPDYAWNDTMRAIEECTRWNVRFGGITTSDEQEVLDQISPAGTWAKCEDVEDLPEALTAVFGRLTGQG